MKNSSINKLKIELVKDEGFRREGYICTQGKITWGIGFTYITEEEADFILDRRVKEISINLEKYLEEQKIDLDENRKIVLSNMIYQLGFDGVKKFKNMWKAIKNMDYETASKEMLDSRWYKQTPSRAKRLADKMLTGG